MAQASDPNHHPTAKESVSIVEVGPRDGLQYESEFFPTEKKISLVDLLSQAGLAKIEVTSFVHPKVIPHLRDANDVLDRITKQPGVVYSALVPNIKGCERAVQTPVDDIALFVSASQTHNQKNVGMSIEESLKGFKAVAQIALAAGKTLRGYVVTAFGCPYEGRISAQQVQNIIAAYADMGVTEISLGDTTGMANPKMTATFVAQVLDAAPQIKVAAHFHNSRGLGLANVYAALKAGIRIFDSSVAGLGGCPTAVGAMGNIATEDLVNMLEEMGYDTGVDFDQLIKAANIVKEVLNTEPASYTFKQGRPVWKNIT